MSVGTHILRISLTRLPVIQSCVVVSSRFFKPNRHFNPKFKKLRGEKFLPVPQLDDYQMQERIRGGDRSVTPAEVRLYMKRLGLPTIRQWRERPINMSSTAEIAEPYQPVDGDGKTSLISTAKLKELAGKGVADVKTLRANRAIKKSKKDFSPLLFGDEAKEIFINAHMALVERDEEKLHQYVTERIFPEMFDELKLRTVQWRFVESFEPPKLMQSRVFEGLSKDYMFAQVTVRLHSKQILAIYDQFGRLMLGDDKVARDVLEYAVFERLITDEYSSWRLHGKVLPPSHPRQPVLRTFRQLPVEPEPTPTATEADETEDKPQLAAA